MESLWKTKIRKCSRIWTYWWRSTFELNRIKLANSSWTRSCKISLINWYVSLCKVFKYSNKGNFTKRSHCAQTIWCHGRIMNKFLLGILEMHLNCVRWLWNYHSGDETCLWTLDILQIKRTARRLNFLEMSGEFSSDFRYLLLLR